MAYTEDDTFIALKRAPFREAFVVAVREAYPGESVGEKCEKELLRIGWTVPDLQERVSEEIQKGTISLAYDKVTSIKYLDNILRHGPI